VTASDSFVHEARALAPQAIVAPGMAQGWITTFALGVSTRILVVTHGGYTDVQVAVNCP
jgi:hypothetical protein